MDTATVMKLGAKFFKSLEPHFPYIQGEDVGTPLDLEMGTNTWSLLFLDSDTGSDSFLKPSSLLLALAFVP